MKTNVALVAEKLSLAQQTDLINATRRLLKAVKQMRKFGVVHPDGSSDFWPNTEEIEILLKDIKELL